MKKLHTNSIQPHNHSECFLYANLCHRCGKGRDDCKCTPEECDESAPDDILWHYSIRKLKGDNYQLVHEYHNVIMHVENRQIHCTHVLTNATKTFAVNELTEFNTWLNTFIC